ncbi:MAG: hypothetical protein U9P10_14795 [Thermodesulfobacteriota bacterium]|nr:hypothetical protein [Thermodesulfobacteriota bacterium]
MTSTGSVIEKTYRHIRLFRKKISRSELAVKLMGLHAHTGSSTDPGLVMIQVDGLGFDQLEKGLSQKQLPFIKEPIIICGDMNAGFVQKSTGISRKNSGMSRKWCLSRDIPGPHSFPSVHCCGWTIFLFPGIFRPSPLLFLQTGPLRRYPIISPYTQPFL